jgi:GNAT superfamily N-acetyltransferase
MSEIIFRTAWRRDAAALIRDAKQFWLGLGLAMSEEEADERARELCGVAYEGDKLIAVSTVMPYFYPRLRSRFAFYRSMVAPEFRRQNLASRLCVYSRDLLAGWSIEHPEEKLMGLLIVFESDQFKGHRNAPVAVQLGLQLYLVGYKANDHIRVVWFDHATVE